MSTKVHPQIEVHVHERSLSLLRGVDESNRIVPRASRGIHLWKIILRFDHDELAIHIDNWLGFEVHAETKTCID